MLAMATVAMLPLFSVSGAPAPILEYRFNDTPGTTAASSGSSATGVGFLNSAGSSVNLYVADQGVFGLGDGAFNNSASTAMGNAGTGGRATTGGAVSAIDGLTSFTLQGWFKTAGSTGIGRDAQLINFGSWNLRAQGDSVTGNLDLQVTGTSILDAQSTGAFNTNGTYNQTQAWVFFAVTYDGSLSSSNVNFYQGSQAGAVTLVSTRTLNAGPPVSTSASFGIGNVANDSTRPFDGFLDNIRVYGSKTDGTGVLTLSELETVRQFDLVPEPSAAGLAAAGLVLGALRRRRGKG
jgi:MYXO-CTERM domain-containing protein